MERISQKEYNKWSASKKLDYIKNILECKNGVVYGVVIKAGLGTCRVAPYNKLGKRAILFKEQYSSTGLDGVEKNENLEDIYPKIYQSKEISFSTGDYVKGVLYSNGDEVVIGELEKMKSFQALKREVVKWLNERCIKKGVYFEADDIVAYDGKMQVSEWLLEKVKIELEKKFLSNIDSKKEKLENEVKYLQNTYITETQKLEKLKLEKQELEKSFEKYGIFIENNDVDSKKEYPANSYSNLIDDIWGYLWKNKNLYYEKDIIKCFMNALRTRQLILLWGKPGTGKTSLPRAEDEFSVGKLADLYERWCCVKMVLIFIQTYGFRLVNDTAREDINEIEALKQYITDILETADTLSQTKFELISTNPRLNDMRVTIWYEPNIDIGGRYPLKPDLVMKVNAQYRGRRQSRIFVFDAKYRGIEKDDYDQYDGIADLCDIALKKYIIRLEKGIKPGAPFYDEYLPEKNQIAGSFILHSNSEAVWDIKKNTSLNEKKLAIEKKEKVILSYNPQQYLGAYIDKWCEIWMDAVENYNKDSNKNFEENRKWKKNRNRELNASPDQLKNWCEWKKPDANNNENRLGIVSFTPKDNQLLYIIQMIMERYFDFYEVICWLCGGNVDVEKKPTGTTGRYFKYYIYCPKCAKNTVHTHCVNYLGWEKEHEHGSEIGKRIENYYANSIENYKFSHWNVSCPICRMLLPPKNTTKKNEYIREQRDEEKHWEMLMKSYNG